MSQVGIVGEKGESTSLHTSGGNVDRLDQVIQVGQTVLAHRFGAINGNADSNVFLIVEGRGNDTLLSMIRSDGSPKVIRFAATRQGGTGHENRSSSLEQGFAHSLGDIYGSTPQVDDGTLLSRTLHPVDTFRIF